MFWFLKCKTTVSLVSILCCAENIITFNNTIIKQVQSEGNSW